MLKRHTSSDARINWAKERSTTTVHQGEGLSSASVELPKKAGVEPALFTFEVFGFALHSSSADPAARSEGFFSPRARPGLTANTIMMQVTRPDLHRQFSSESEDGSTMQPSGPMNPMDPMQSTFSHLVGRVALTDAVAEAPWVGLGLREKRTNHVMHCNSNRSAMLNAKLSAKSDKTPAINPKPSRMTPPLG